MTLAETQARLFSALFADHEPMSTVSALLTPLPAATLRQRLDIYVETLRYKTGNRLASFYARTVRLLGRERFQEIVDTYLGAASTDRAFPRLVEAFPEHLQSLEALRPDVAALARVERARNQVAEEPAQLGVTLQALLAIPPADLDGLRLTFVAALRLFETNRDTTAVWRSLEDDATPPEPSPAAPEPMTHLAWVVAGQVLHRALDPQEAAALACALSGATLAEICEHFEHTANPAAAAHAALQSWFDDGLVAALHPPCVH